MRVFATRPSAQNSGWIKRLEQLGYAPVDFSLLEIRELTSPKQLQKIKNSILDLDVFYALIFVSQNAVSYGLAKIDQYWPQLPAGLNWFAVGTKTAKYLQSHPLLCSENIYVAENKMNSEELLEDPLLQAECVEGKKILIFRGYGGRPKLAEVLEQRGAEIKYCELYERLLPEGALDKLINYGVDASDVVPVFSGEALSHFSSLLEQAKKPRACKLIVPGQRVADLAGNLGFENAYVSENASEESMLETLRKIN